MANFLQIFVPQDKKFFPMFEKASANLEEASKALVALVNASTPEKRKELTKEIERLEHVGDDITHEIMRELSLSFITPFDREDVHALVSSIDDIVDFTQGSAKRLDFYHVEVTPPIIKLAELVHQGAVEIHNAMKALGKARMNGNIKDACLKINAIENHSDDIYDMAIAQLFEQEKDAVKIIKYKEVLTALEDATDKCEDAADVLESIMLKHG